VGLVPWPLRPYRYLEATSNGQGRSVYKLYYLLEMNINDAFPSGSDYSSTITVELLLTTP
jgi:hypothetical protein